MKEPATTEVPSDSYWATKSYESNAAATTAILGAQEMMTAEEVRNWVGKYYLFTLAFIGGYIYIFSESILLPLERNEALAAGETIIPVFLGQIAIIYRWFFSPTSKDTVGDATVPRWLVTSPPILALLLIGLSIASLIFGNQYPEFSSPDPDQFRRIVVFVVSLLNVTTVILIMRYFSEWPTEKTGAKSSSKDQD